MRLAAMRLAAMLALLLLLLLLREGARSCCLRQ